MNKHHLILGLGATGISCLEYLRRQGHENIVIADSRPNPPKLAEIKNKYPNIPIFLGDFNEETFDCAERIILSPGISLKHPVISKYINKGIPVMGDIELFVRDAKKPIIAITGTNAKSTVTTLVGEMAKAAGIKVGVGGNLGTPALDLLEEKNLELFVLELSSFQLETTHSLKAAVATVLNISPDHMDRYDNIEAYCQAKHKIYHECRVAISNKDDILTHTNHSNVFQFTLFPPQKNEFGLTEKNNSTFLSFENESLLSTKLLPIHGKHYQANALAALAIGHGYGLPMEVMLQTLKNFKGLPHRCQFVRKIHGVTWYNDSKGTNVGATLAAIDGLGPEIEGKIILIAGGIGKNADFSLLNPAIERFVKRIILIGVDAPIMRNAFGKAAPMSEASSMEEAIQYAHSFSEAGDCVLLSPACASFDMFNNFEHRGQVFTDLVNKL